MEGSVMLKVKDLEVTTDQRTRACFGRFLFSGDYPAGGEVINGTDIGSPGGDSAKPPLWTQIVGRRQNALSYFYAVDYSTWKLTVSSVAGGVMTELPAGPYPQEVIDDSADFHFRFLKF
jgi:hypothetical protein